MTKTKKMTKTNGNDTDSQQDRSRESYRNGGWDNVKLCVFIHYFVL